MAILDFIKKQFIDIIEWTDDSRDTLSYRFPDEDKEIKNGAQLIVRESQVAQFVYLGQFGDTFGPGKHTLVTDNIPILTNLKSWKYALESPFKADVYYVVTRLFTGNKWGTANPVMMRDADFGIVRLRAYGTYDFRIVDVKKFLKEVAGTDDHFRLDEFNDTMRSRIVSVFTDALASAKIPALDVAARYGELGEALLPLINPGDRREVRPRDDHVHRRERVGAAGSGSGHRQALEHGGGGQPQRLREVPDGQRHGVGHRRRRGRHRGRDGDGHGDGAADDEPDGRPDGAGDAGHPGARARRPRRAGRGAARPDDAGAGRADARRGRVRRDGEPRCRRSQGQAHRHAVARDARCRRHVPQGLIMVTSIHGRRGALVALLLWAFACAAPALAQDPRVSAAQAAARDWLVLTDAGNATASYGAAGEKYRTVLTADQWTKALASVRTPLGAVAQRTFANGQIGKPQGAPDGEYAMVVFRTAFANKTDTAETLTLEREPDGKWRVIGYSIR